MSLGPRTKLALIAALFAAPIVASTLVYLFGHPAATANHGELLLPPATVSAGEFTLASGKPFSFAELRGRWILATSDSGACGTSCGAKLLAMRQVRLALGRDAERVARVLVVDDGRVPDAAVLAPYEGTEAVVAPKGSSLAAGAGDREHVYLVDPHGNVMMRWGAADDPRGMIKDLERLLKASQIG
ncbi:MAG TPA: hypothetical protein VEG27_14000 [Usitatibacter sp.]|nr:hypothetical protein [Usitatibacter sp.]